MAKTGLQMYTVRDATKIDFLGTIRKVADMGYTGLELAGYFDTEAPVLKAVLDEKGLELAASHVIIQNLEGNFDAEADYCEAIGCPTIICPFIPSDQRQSVADWKQIAARFNVVGAKCRDRGLKFMYHHHGYDFAEVDGTTGFDVLLAELNTDLVQLEFDAFWLEDVGINCVEFYEQHHQIVPSLHLKDMNNRNEKKDTEVGNGVLDIAGLIRAGLRHGVEWLVIEQEKYDRPPMESAELNLRNLERMLAAGKA